MNLQAGRHKHNRFCCMFVVEAGSKRLYKDCYYKTYEQS